MKKIYMIFLLPIALLCACVGDKSKDNNEEASDNIESVNDSYSDNEEEGYSGVSNLVSSTNDDEGAYPDGTYSATVTYENPNTGYSNSYDLDVEVSDGHLVQINFPNGGWLDDSHMNPPKVDENGNCTVETYDGKIYEINIH